ncbi:MAG: hypothetical protein PHR81_09475 [Bacteroidales bacterium]|nr:hypothetical protein [Bacteroidales bacterium]MDD4215028.1 hypothetical protein [Bacteroidales bacterium]
MDQRHQEYIEYYRVRMKKYENNPVYKNSYEAEKNIFDAIQNSTSLEEFRTRLENVNLPLKNAIALTKDKSLARKELYENINEPIRKKASEQTLDMIETVQSVNELTQKANEIEAAVSIEVSIDLFTSYFYSDFIALENIEVWQQAEIPPEWHKEIHEEWVNESLAEGRKIWTKVVIPESQKWKPDWNFDYKLIWEDRHRRLIPVPDEVIMKRIEQFKTYRGI